MAYLVGVLRSGVLWSVGSRIAHNEQKRLGIVLLHVLAQEVDRIVGDQVGVVVGRVIEPMFDLEITYVKLWSAKRLIQRIRRVIFFVFVCC